MSPSELDAMLSRLGLIVRKVTNTRSNTGRTATVCLAEALTLFYDGEPKQEADDGPELFGEPAHGRYVAEPATDGRCAAYRQGDEMTCRCGARWDIGEPSPCPRNRGPA